jgi:RecA-family ATPase
MSRVQDRPGFVPVSEYLRLPHDSNTWLVKDLIPTSGAALIYGLPKGGKSWLAIQLACCIAGGDKDWLGFPVQTQGRVLYLQLDTPRSTWRLRFDSIVRERIKFDDRLLCIADRESIDMFPFDISKESPDHMAYLASLVRPLQPVAVVVDTLRKAHSKDENNSTDMSNVISRLVAAVHPAALIIVSHSRKPNIEAGDDLMSDHRGSGSVTGEMDCVLKMAKKKLYYGGRNIEGGRHQARPD